MRLVPSTDLRALLAAEGPLEPRRALAIARQAAEALDAAHARGLLHRDVKPANVLLDREDGTDEHVYLTDFGLAVPAPGSGALERGGFRGTAAYAAPEQIAGRAEPRSDLYSLACVLYECLTGEPPFRERRLLALLWAHVNDTPRRPSELRPGLPPAADDALLAGLRKEAEARPTTCTAFIAGVEKALGLARGRRPRARVAVAAAVAATAVATAVLSGLVTGDSSPPPAAPADGPRLWVVVGKDGAAADPPLADPWSVAVDSRGTLYVSEAAAYRIRRVERGGAVTTVVGPAEPTDNSEITDVALAVDRTDTLHVLDFHLPALRRLERDGTLALVAGDGSAGALAPGVTTVSERLCARPEGLAFDRLGRPYVACETAHRVIRIEPDGSFTTIAGSGEAGFSGDGGPAVEAALHRPSGVAIDEDGTVYIADQLNHRIRVVHPDGTIATFAGTGRAGLSADGWRATAVDIWAPNDVAVGADGSVYFSEPQINRVRRVDPRGMIMTVAGTGRAGRAADGDPAGTAPLSIPVDIDVDAEGNVFIAEQGNDRVVRIGPPPR